MNELLGSEAFWQILVMVVALVWSLPQVVSWRAKIKEGRMKTVMQIADLAVSSAYVHYTQPRKDEAPEGKLSTVQKAAARIAADTAFLKIAEEQNCGLVSTLSKQVREAILEIAYKALKKGTEK